MSCAFVRRASAKITPARELPQNSLVSDMLARVICVLAVGSSSALQIGAPQGRRAFLSQLAAAGTLAASPLAAQAISARTGLSSPFTGEYDDKNHPGCLRSMCGMFKAHHLGSATAPPRVGVLGFGGSRPPPSRLILETAKLVTP